jgi:exosortase
VGRPILFWLILAGLGATIYAEPLLALCAAVLQRHDSSHGLFVPFIAGYILWLKLDKIKAIPYRSALPAAAIALAVAFALFLLGQSTSGIALSIVSFLLVAAGLVLAFFGRDLFKEVSFPLFFLAAMIPLPEAVYSQIADWMRGAITGPAVALIKPLGIPVHREGYNIHLPNIQLYVAHGCSAIRYLLSFFVFGIAYAFRFKHSTQSRLLVVAATVPLAIAGGVLRLWIIFATAYYIGPIMTERRPHVLLSWSVFMVMLVAAIGVDRYLTWRKKTKLFSHRPTQIYTDSK